MRVHILLWLCGLFGLALFTTQAVLMAVGVADILFGVLAATCQFASMVMFAWGIHVAHDAPQSRRWLRVGQAPLWLGVFLLLGTVVTVQ